MDNLISIVVPNYNGEITIKKCLDFIFSQNYDNFEVVVVDDCSTDNSIEIIRSYQKVKLIELNKNQGPAVARNEGADNSKGDIIVFVDSDVCLPESALSLIKKTFEEEQDTQAIVGMPDRFCKFENMCSQHFNLRVHFNYLNLPPYISIIYGSIFAVRRKTFFEVGGLDARFKTAGVEDDDLGIRISQKGYKIKHLKNLQINHYKPVSLRKLIKNDFFRAADRIKLMLRKRFINKTFREKRFLTTPNEQIYSAMAIPLFFITFILTIAVKEAIWLNFIPLLIFYYFNRKYLLFIKKVRGVFYSVRLYFLLLIDMAAVNMGILYGLIDYVSGRKF